MLDGLQAELLTPTGALVLTSYADAYGPVPAMRLSSGGLRRRRPRHPETPNVVRVLVGDADDAQAAMRVS